MSDYAYEMTIYSDDKWSEWPTRDPHMRANHAVLQLVSIFGADHYQVLIKRQLEQSSGKEEFTVSAAEFDVTAIRPYVKIGHNGEQHWLENENDWKEKFIEPVTATDFKYPTNEQFAAALELAKLKLNIPLGVHFYRRAVAPAPAG